MYIEVDTVPVMSPTGYYQYHRRVELSTAE